MADKDADAIATLNRFYAYILNQELVYLAHPNRRIPVKIDPLLPKGRYHISPESFVGSQIAVLAFIETGKIVTADGNS